MRDVYEDLHAAFSKYDSRRRGYLVATDFQKMLFEFNILLNDDQMFDLIERYTHIPAETCGRVCVMAFF